MMYGNHPVGWLWMTLSILGMLAIWALLIGAVVVALRGRDRGAGVEPPRSPAESLLGERFARGEIGDDEYRQRMRTLRTRLP